MAQRPMWTCPECDRQFSNRNQWHSCDTFTVEQHLVGKSEHVVQLYAAFVALIEDIGPVNISPVKTGILFKVRKTFAEVNVRQKWLIAHVVLPHGHDHPRFTKIETLSPLDHVHTFRVDSLSGLDADVEEWLREAYWVGEQRHLPKR